MELRNIIAFLKVAELNSFSKAAVDLGYTQSNVTMQIKQLESELDTILFDRIGKTISLTESGKIFFHYARTIIASVTEAKDALSNTDIPSGELRIGILESLCITYMPQLIQTFHINFPQVNTIIEIGTFEELSLMLNSNSIDLLWTFDPIITNSDWITDLTYPNPISILASPSHNLCHQKKLPLSCLSNEIFIFTENNCSYRSAFENLLVSHNIPFQIFMEIGNTEIIKKFVASGLCLSVLPQFTIQTELQTKQLQTISISEFDLTMYGQVFHHKNKWVTPAMTEFLALLLETTTPAILSQI